MRIILMIVVPALLIFAVALIVLWVPLPRPLPPPASGARNLMAAATTGILGVGYLAGVLVYVFSSLAGASRALDAAFASRGLVAQGTVLTGRRYEGQVSGRQVEIRFAASVGLQPALLQIVVFAAAGTRAAVVPDGPRLDCRDCARVTQVPASLSHLQIYAEEAAWVARLLAEEGNIDTLSHLMRDQQSSGSRELYIQPDRVWLRAHPAPPVTPLDVEGWFETVLTLAEAVEQA